MKLRFLFFIPLLLLFVSCDREITDFFKFINDRGFHFTKPLSEKGLPVDEQLLGGYLYESSPILISKKDNNTYQINFLTTELNREDRIIEAHMTSIKGTRFLNLDMGGYYSVVRVNLMYNQEFKMNLLKSEFYLEKTEDEVRSALRSNPELETFDEVESDHSSSAFYSVSFSKITKERALEIQEEELYSEKRYRYKNCESYREFEQLKERYPHPELYELSETSLYNRCHTIEDYREFMRYFPKSKHNRDAQFKIAEIKAQQKRLEEIAKDSTAFEYAKETNTIEGFEAFLEHSATDVYTDRAKQEITTLAQYITTESIEWQRTSGKTSTALQHIYYKIDYCETIENASWYISKLPEYVMESGTNDDQLKAIDYLGKLSKQTLTSDDKLNLYLEKGFLLWNTEQFDLSLAAFKSQVNKSYSDGETFQQKIKSRYKSFKNNDTLLPDQKAFWKKVKKLK